MSKKDKDSLLKRNLTTVLNAMSRESVSDTPDYVLGQYLLDCLKAFERATDARAEWRGANSPMALQLAQDYYDHEAADQPEEPAPGEQVTDVYGFRWQRLESAHAEHWCSLDSTEPSAMITWKELCAVGWTQAR